MQVKKQLINYKPTKMNYQIDRSWQDVFCNTLNLLGFTSYATPEDDSDLVFDKEVNGYICGDYIVRPDDNYNDLPNFEHIPSGLKMSWYKYPLRSAMANQNLSFVEFMRMLGWERE
jgi:hypothetical protein